MSLAASEKLPLLRWPPVGLAGSFDKEDGAAGQIRRPSLSCGTGWMPIALLAYGRAFFKPFAGIEQERTGWLCSLVGDIGRLPAVPADDCRFCPNPSASPLSMTTEYHVDIEVAPAVT